MDPFHPLGRVKRLRSKPLASFDQSDTYLRIHQAEQEGLITVSLQAGTLTAQLQAQSSALAPFTGPIHFSNMPIHTNLLRTVCHSAF